jgi:hypothetical protein
VVGRDPSLATLSERMSACDPAAWCEVFTGLVNAVAARYDVDVRAWAVSRP